ncbi:MAG: amylo-alpha-1,6-glucosidase, partial [Deltaproteobacteria bacterium]
PATSSDVAFVEGRVSLRPNPALPAVVATTNGSYQQHPDWYRQFRYDVERQRGLDFVEDCLAPGTFRFELSKGDAGLLLEAGPPGAPGEAAPLERVEAAFEAERRRRGALPGPRGRAADAYLVRRGEGATIVAGYPWFTDWGRDTFISLRGLCLATGRLELATTILLEWARTVNLGMLPNRFPDGGEAPEYNSVDASLWFVVAVHELFRAAPNLAPGVRGRLEGAVDAILTGYSTGTRHGIRGTDDGLLACGEPGSNLTWMDARYDDHAVTPRIGKPVEVQALWLAALTLAGEREPRWRAQAERGRGAFEPRFWNEARGGLFDVVDEGHVSGRNDDRIRPNQLFAAGALPVTLLSEERARRVVDQALERLWTPLGLRTLAPGEPGYAGRYRGDRAARDEAYHQGTAWPWLVGPFVEAFWRSRGATREAAREADARFLAPLRGALGIAGLGHLTEVSDGDEPQAPGGCPFQAWSLAELLRLERLLGG